MSRANLSMFEADLSASWLNLQRILNFYLLRNLASNELFFTILEQIMDIEKIFDYARENNISDIHLLEGEKIYFRKNG